MTDQEHLDSLLLKIEDCEERLQSNIWTPSERRRFEMQLNGYRKIANNIKSRLTTAK
jgi:hypothetical protein